MAYILPTESVEREDKTDRECENFMLVLGVSFFRCEDFFEYEGKGNEKMRKIFSIF